MSDVKQEVPTPGSNSSGPGMLVVEIGKKQKRKRIKQLRQGRGRLFERINDVVDDLRTEGAVGGKTATIVVVVRQKARTGRLIW